MRLNLKTMSALIDTSRLQDLYMFSCVSHQSSTSPVSLSFSQHPEIRSAARGRMDFVSLCDVQAASRPGSRMPFPIGPLSWGVVFEVSRPASGLLAAAGSPRCRHQHFDLGFNPSGVGSTLSKATLLRRPESVNKQTNTQTNKQTKP